MPFTEPPPRLPPASEPVVDPQTGRMSAAWLNYFDRLIAYLARLAASLT
jgi:hypothetical protein